MEKGITLVEILIIITIVGSILVMPIIVYFSASMEAKQFNRFSKTQITWWDALWADYRILPDK